MWLGLAMASALLPLATTTASASQPSHITQLRFVSPSQPHGMPRRTRRLSPAGLQLHGNLHTLGYFSADVCVGTPARTFDLIVDTGSSLTAFPCEDCSHCGAHMHGNQRGARFSFSASSSSELCHLGSCSYSTVFTEGSSIRGRIIFDSFWLGSAQLDELYISMPSV